MPRFQTDLIVRSYEIDALGHVNHSVYLNYFEQARYDALAEGGFPHTELFERGWGVVVVRVEVDYHRPCFQGDELGIVTLVEQLRGSSMEIRHEVFRKEDGPEADPITTARAILVWVGENGRPMRIPPAARAALGGADRGGPAPG
jgi:acyl-CoA thioester hydrolase